MKPHADSIRNAATLYQSQGLAVLPIHSIDHGSCSCGSLSCPCPAKHPRTLHGVKDASNDQEIINGWLEKSPTTNIGIATGAPSGVIVLDIDPRNRGDTSLRDLEAQHGALPMTWRARTGGGGEHVYFRMPIPAVANRTGLAPGLDLKSDGGYVVAPPSMHASGRLYEWAAGCTPGECDLAECPAWLLQKLKQQPPAAAGDDPRSDPIARNGDLANLVEAGTAYASRCDPVKEGTRNNAAFSIAGHLFALRSESRTRLPAPVVVQILNKFWNQRNANPLPPEELASAVESAEHNGTPRSLRTVSADHGQSAGRDPARQLVELLISEELFISDDSWSLPYIRIEVGGVVHCHRIDSEEFIDRVQQFAWDRGLRSSVAVVREAAQFLASRARTVGIRKQVGLRVAADGPDILLDRGSADRSAIRVTAQGWVIDPKPTCAFRRTAGMQALPIPTEEGSLEPLRQLCNIENQRDWALLRGFLVGACRPRAEYPLLILTGEKGTGKSTAAAMIRALIDPHTAPLRAAPGSLRDLMIASLHNHVLALDNISELSQAVSDGLCHLSTGGGFATRSLYSNAEEVIISESRPIIASGIPQFATAGDLLDRAILIELPRIPPRSRRPKETLWRDFNLAHPAMLGALLRGVAAALRDCETTELPVLPRMASFARWVFAAAPALGMTGQEFLDAYTQSLTAGDDLVIESSPVSIAIRDFARDQGFWSGEARQLLGILTAYQPLLDQLTTKNKWPTDPGALGSELRRAAPSLLELGVRVEFSKSRDRDKRRIITITDESKLHAARQPDSSSHGSPPEGKIAA
jgi:hypothetical protein